MANNFTVRVELHGADKRDYEKLHSEMESAGFSRIIGDSFHKYHLPEAEYIIDSLKTGNEICAQVDKIAIKIGKECASILASAVGNRFYLNLKPVKQ